MNIDFRYQLIEIDIEIDRKIDLLSIIIGKDFSHLVEASSTLTHCCLCGIIESFSCDIMHFF